MAEMTVEQLRRDPDYEQVPTEEIPALECYRKKNEQNVLFVGEKRNGQKIVLDRFVQFMDVKGVIKIMVREKGVLRDLDEFLKGALSVVKFATNPAFTLVLKHFGAEDTADTIRKFLTNVGGKIDATGLPQLLRELNYGQIAVIHNVMKKALRDGVLTETEEAEIGALVDLIS